MNRAVRRAGIATWLLLALAAPGPSGAAARPEGNEPAWSQDRGFSIGLQYHVNLVGAEDPGPGSAPDQLFIDETGQGLVLLGGYAFTPHFCTRLVLGTAAHRTTQSAVEVYHSSAVLEAHYRFLPRERARPYVFGGLGGSDIRTDQKGFHVQISGGVAVLGVGMLYNLTEHLVADLTLRLDQINWTSVKVTQDLPNGSSVRLEDPIEESGSAGKLLLGLVWQF